MESSHCDRHLSAEREAPRKRQRTVEPELVNPIRSSAHEAGLAGPSASGGIQSSEFPPPIGNAGPSRCGHAEPGAHTQTISSGDTLQMPTRPDAGGADDEGDAPSPAEDMNAGGSGNKGKARATTATMPATNFHASDSSPHAGPAVRGPAQVARRGNRDCDRANDAHTSRHAASGADAKAPQQAMDIDDSGLAPAAVGAQAENEPTRDAEYYIHGADCVIRVEDTLFRVHRYFLGRDNSAFQHMFSIPSQDVHWQNEEGSSDDSPIHLYGESAERFRALLSVIYDLPSQLQAYNTPGGNIDRLLTICEMTNKYHFASMETWAVDALFNVISCLHGPPAQQYHLTYCSSSWMKRMLDVALLCGHERLRQHVADRWTDRILARDLRPVHALDVPLQTGTSKLVGTAYYVQLLELGPDFEPGVVEDGKQYARSQRGGYPTTATGGGAAAAAAASTEPRTGTRAALTREQKQRLLSGHWSLTRLWERLRTTPPAFERPEGCTYHQRGCVSTWAHVWQDVAQSPATARHDGVDVLARLKTMAEQLFLHAELANALSPQCKRAAMLALKATMTEVKEGLAEYFSDLTADEGHQVDDRG